MKNIVYTLVLACFLVTSAHAAFNDLGDGTVWDDSTGLMWQKIHGKHTGDPGLNGNVAFFTWGDGTCDGTAENEDDALCYCSNLSLGPVGTEYTDWRVPDRNELHSTFDYTNSPVALADEFLDEAAAPHFFWTSTTTNALADNNKAWAAGPIGDGKLTQNNLKTNTNHVRCVRGRVFKVNVAPAGADLTVTDADEGDNWVDYGTDQAVTYTASSGAIGTLLVDGVDQGPQVSPFTYTFTGVTKNHTISATAAPNSYSVSVTVGDNGTVTDVDNSVVINPPGGTVLATMGEERTFAVTPAAGYAIDAVQYDGADVVLDGSNQYTTPAINENGHVFSATFVAVEADATSNLLLTMPPIINGAQKAVQE